MDYLHLDSAAAHCLLTLYQSLGEKDSRRLAGAIYQILGNAKLSDICSLLSVSEKTVRKGLSELQEEQLPCPGRQRVKGGGRKVKWDDKDLNEAFRVMIQPFTAGDPMKPEVKWTNLSPAEISKNLRSLGFEISRNTTRKLLKYNGFKKRRIQKRKSMKVVQDRDQQFNEINSARKDFEQTGDPVISVDTKKKEPIGENYRHGESYATGQVDGPDHTFAHLDIGKAVPHGIYDTANNKAFMHIGQFAETAEFIIDSIVLWWKHDGRQDYPTAKRILILFDAGGANSYRHHVFKKELQRLANELGIEVKIKHYPSYASKWNPIEHRVFPHVQRTISGVLIRSFEEFKSLVSRAKTKTGLTVKVESIAKEYKTGQRGEKADWVGTIKFDEILPKWNYGCSPVF